MSTLVSPDGTTIAFETVGDGPALILVDGASCYRDAGPMRSIADALSVTFEVVLYDRRGRGASGDTLPFAVQREIEDLGALIDQVGGAARLFGISSGAALVLAAAEALGAQKVTGIALFEPPFMPPPALPAAAVYTRELQAALAAGDRAAAVELFLARVGLPPQAIEGMRHSPAWPGMESIAPTLAYDDAAMGDSAVPVERAKRIRVPALALVGGASPDFLRYGAEEVAAALPSAEVVVLEGQTHDVAAEAVAPALVDFFTARDLSRA
ncbi:alpha/beta fold hydrolase [Leifsonia sp. NPDC058230]|uniref:alpha/beta fold hydrolase n=1 Tax=Leifsonia sp. NPDC058230 TaxID=3346391 RepID=UPI0036D9C891